MSVDAREKIRALIVEEFSNSNYIEAEIMSELYCKLCDGNSASKFILGQIYLFQGKINSADEALSHCNSAEALYLRAQVLFYLERFIEALEVISLSIEYLNQSGFSKKNYLLTFPTRDDVDSLKLNISFSLEGHKSFKNIEPKPKEHNFGIIYGIYFFEKYIN